MKYLSAQRVERGLWLLSCPGRDGWSYSWGPHAFSWSCTVRTENIFLLSLSSSQLKIPVGSAQEDRQASPEEDPVWALGRHRVESGDQVVLELGVIWVAAHIRTEH